MPRRSPRASDPHTGYVPTRFRRSPIRPASSKKSDSKPAETSAANAAPTSPSSFLNLRIPFRGSPTGKAPQIPSLRVPSPQIPNQSASSLRLRYSLCKSSHQPNPANYQSLRLGGGGAGTSCKAGLFFSAQAGHCPASLVHGHGRALKRTLTGAIPPRPAFGLLMSAHPTGSRIFPATKGGGSGNALHHLHGHVSTGLASRPLTATPLPPRPAAGLHKCASDRLTRTPPSNDRGHGHGVCGVRRGRCMLWLGLKPDRQSGLKARRSARQMAGLKVPYPGNLYS